MFAYILSLFYDGSQDWKYPVYVGEPRGMDFDLWKESLGLFVTAKVDKVVDYQVTQAKWDISRKAEQAKVNTEIGYKSALFLLERGW